jgi:hypothetical protein
MEATTTGFVLSLCWRATSLVFLRALSLTIAELEEDSEDTSIDDASERVSHGRWP